MVHTRAPPSASTNDAKRACSTLSIREPISRLVPSGTNVAHARIDALQLGVAKPHLPNTGLRDYALGTPDPSMDPGAVDHDHHHVRCHSRHIQSQFQHSQMLRSGTSTLYSILLPRGRFPCRRNLSQLKHPQMHPFWKIHTVLGQGTQPHDQSRYHSRIHAIPSFTTSSSRPAEITQLDSGTLRRATATSTVD
ncbi:hypothetical protein P171DRAFT_46643 [Karstenula rhodostoma CBS 690.94]|uniref:Uncharacterized protein n=1 Tax=Karstenula rhodostoma CBS 690.94 TaxID=1392251 RepID=A0A9P4PIR2_9PLEO|nr:hypothetical protein P171DRAFT_46643 [Karstenula rhodostoma CBS 690.94]